MTAPESFKAWPDTSGTPGYLHGAKAKLKPGDLIQAGRSSNCGQGKNAAFVYLTGTLDATTWGAELAIGDGPGRNYIVAPMGPIEDNPNLTDKKFPGNPRDLPHADTAPGHRRARRLQGHAREQLQAMKDGLARLAAQGVEAINE